MVSSWKRSPWYRGAPETAGISSHGCSRETSKNDHLWCASPILCPNPPNATVPHGRILGHEGLGTVESVGPGVTAFKPGEKVIISCITACGTCESCRRGMLSHCESGGWILGNTIDGTQAEYVRVPHANASLHHVPVPAANSGDGEKAEAVNGDALVMISDILPTAMECGTLSGKVRPGSSVAIVGAGPVGLAALMTAQLYTPEMLIVLDRDAARLDAAKKLGATHTVIVSAENAEAAVKEVMRLTDGRGVDTAVEAVGSVGTFEMCQDIIGVGGTLANVGVHGDHVDLHLEKLWDRNVDITTRLVDTVTAPMLIRLLQKGRLDAGALATHTFPFSDIEKAYAAFADAANNRALKVIIDFEGED